MTCLSVDVLSGPDSSRSKISTELEFGSDEVVNAFSVIEKLCEKSQYLSTVLTENDYIMNRHSIKHPEKWILVGDKSPLKDGMSLSVEVKPRKNLLNSTFLEPREFIPVFFLFP